ncbi:MAG: O-antigen ligase family protein [Candidatus Helarchaeota archaeon]
MPKFSLIFTFIILTVFAFSIVYSLNNLENINFRRIIEEKSEFSIFSYILQSFVRPLFYFLPFIIIVKYLKNADRIKKLTNIIALSLTILSISLLYVYIFKIGIMGDIRKATEIYSITFGLHRNDIADYFILGFPYLLAGFFIKKNILNIFVICLSILATGFLFSRTAYVIIFFSIIFYLIISKRAKLLPILIAFILILSFLISSSIILERASKGISSGDRNEITAGRIDNIWLPLIDEYIHNPKKLFLGNGRYAIISSDAVAYGLTQDTMWHPHNMYLEQIIDSGILCFFLVIFLYIKFFTKILKTLKIINNYVLKEYLYASIISLISYFISGLTGRSLFPTLKNSFFWISMGITVAIINIFENYKQKVSVEN